MEHQSLLVGKNKKNIMFFFCLLNLNMLNIKVELASISSRQNYSKYSQQEKLMAPEKALFFFSTKNIWIFFLISPQNRQIHSTHTFLCKQDLIISPMVPRQGFQSVLTTYVFVKKYLTNY